ncbi:MAG: MBL fold metallo-hydrolase, partial [Gemmatimonadaceae bacterium]|nr:MBL fold metallo-hydrolase [Gemmatimonadaceae bacterium]
RAGPLPMYGSEGTLQHLAQRFPYIFDGSMRPLPGTSKPEGDARIIRDNESVTIGDATVTAIAVPHGPFNVFAYRIGPLAYVTDAKSIPYSAVDSLRGARVLVINALWRGEHPTHLSISEAIKVAGLIGADRTFLTHLTHDNRHADLEAELPRGISPAFDGLTVRID